ncbi:MAG: protein kinase [Cyanobacteria bacterium J083]|nr:MAG: protein kinase [Cyanobacteria bacterium J083]
MSLCINPKCSNTENPDNQLFCEACGSELLIAGRYRVARLLSSKGGFGKTYEVFHDHAVKVLKVLTNNHPKIVELFEQEARILKQLNHPGIPKGDSSFTYFPRDAQEPLHCLVMEKIEGLDLEEYQNQRSSRPIDQELALEWLTQLMEILHVVHSHNFFHRDIKPSNIILRPTGQLALIDFGAVRQVTATIIAGNQNTGVYTPGYAPPEQEKGYAVPQSDFYALGRTFVYLLTGKSPTDITMYDRYNNELKWRETASASATQAGEVQGLNPAFADLLDEMMAERAKYRPANTTIIIEKLKKIKAQTEATKAINQQQTSSTYPPPTVVSQPASQTPPTQPPSQGISSYPTQAEGKADIQPVYSRGNLDYISAQPQQLKPKSLSRRKLLTIAGFSSAGVLAAAITKSLLSGGVQSSSSITVGQNGTGKYQTIRDAIANAQPGMIISLLPGTYRESIIISQPVELIANGEVGEVVIEGNGSDAIRMQTDTAKVKGVTIIGRAEGNNSYFGVNIARGQLTLEDCDISSDSLSAIGVHGSTADPIIRNCKIHDSKQSGIYFYDNARGTVEDCEIFRNTTTEIAIDGNSNPVIRRCRIHDGKEAGILWRNSGQGLVEDCQIYNNVLSGLDIKQNSNPIVRGCKIYNNSNGDGVLFYDKGLGQIDNCDFYGNKFSGIEIRESANPTVTNCQSRNNVQNGLFVHKKATGTIENCELVSNGYSGLEIREEANPIVRKCRINRNNDYGAYIHNQGRGTVEDCDLTGNIRGAWKIDETSQVQRKGNIT